MTVSPLDATVEDVHVGLSVLSCVWVGKGVISCAGKLVGDEFCPVPTVTEPIVVGENVDNLGAVVGTESGTGAGVTVGSKGSGSKGSGKSAPHVVGALVPLGDLVLLLVGDLLLLDDLVLIGPAGPHLQLFLVGDLVDLGALLPLLLLIVGDLLLLTVGDLVDLADETQLLAWAAFNAKAWEAARRLL